MLGYSREEVCERETNKLHFKKVREILRDNEFYDKMSGFKIQGQKNGEFREFERLRFLKENMSKYDDEGLE
jgi:hypothetical protein